jgi:DNA polymerase-3 subunit gamma/tau
VSAVAVVDPEAASEPTTGSFTEVWPAVLDSLREEAPHLAAVLQSARPARVGDGEVTLAWSEPIGLYLRKVEDPVNRDTIMRVIRAVTGSTVRLAYEVRAEGEAEAAPRISEEELVDRFVQEFDAEVLPDEESR